MWTDEQDESIIPGFPDFLAPLAKGQRAIVMALCPSSVRPSVLACVRKLFLQKTSQKLLTGFLRNFTGP